MEDRGLAYTDDACINHSDKLQTASTLNFFEGMLPDVDMIAGSQSCVQVSEHQESPGPDHWRPGSAGHWPGPGAEEDAR